MWFKKYGTIILLVVALLAAGYGIYSTASTPAPAVARTARRGPSDRTFVVDQRSLITAEQLALQSTSAEERAFAEEALRLADSEMDLAFASAVRRIANLPRATSDTAKEAEARLGKSLRALSDDQAQVAALEKALATANAAAAESLTDRLELAKAQEALDQDDADDARQDLRRAGGDPQGRMQEMIDEHEAASKGSDTIRVVVTKPAESRAVARLVQSWMTIRRKDLQLSTAKAEADSLAIAFKIRHDRVDARAAARLHDSTSARLTHDSAAALLAEAQRRSRDEKTKISLDQRIDDQHALSAVYQGWMGALRTQQRVLLNLLLRSITVILLIILGATLLKRWIERVIRRKSMDGERVHSLFMVARVSLQVVAALLILLVILGPPDNLGTVLGLAGAGLTVALKDFILAFLGWFVLMGSDGIRLGDLVEINGVTGEVVQLGMFHTELLETGGWTESGHPTGRRVTFTNAFAIEGHYFNFSTSGQWLWDEVRVVAPAGRDPYAIAESLRTAASEATAESAREANEQWKHARHLPMRGVPTAEASINLKPVPGGVEISVRFITRTAEREALRSKLYHAAVALLGGAPA